MRIPAEAGPAESAPSTGACGSHVRWRRMSRHLVESRDCVAGSDVSCVRFVSGVEDLRIIVVSKQMVGVWVDFLGGCMMRIIKRHCKCDSLLPNLY